MLLCTSSSCLDEQNILTRFTGKNHLTCDIAETVRHLLECVVTSQVISLPRMEFCMYSSILFDMIQLGHSV